MELNDNKMPGSELKNLTKYKQLRTLKFAGNLLKDFADVEALVISICSHKSLTVKIEIPDRAS